MFWRKKNTPPPCEKGKCTAEERAAQIAAHKAAKNVIIEQGKKANERFQETVKENHFSAKLFITAGGTPPQTARGKN